MITLALVLTPLVSARALAGLCALGGIDVDVVPTSRGAVAVRAVGSPEPGVPDDAAALFEAGPSAPTEAGPTAPVEPGPAAPPDAGTHTSDWDVSELFDSVPAEARKLAAAVSRLTKLGVILLTAELAQDSGAESGLSGQLHAQRYAGGEPGEEVPAGLLLAGADDVVEDLLLGRRSVTDVPGHVSSRDAGSGGRGRWFGKGARRPRP